MSAALHEYQRLCAWRNACFGRLDPSSSNAEAAVILAEIEEIEIALEIAWGGLTAEEQAEYVLPRSCTTNRPTTTPRKYCVCEILRYAIDILLPVCAIILEVLAWQNHRPGIQGSCVPGMAAGAFVVWTVMWYFERFKQPKH